MALPKASDNPFPSLLVVEGTTPASPGAGDQRLFIDSADHKLKRVNSSGGVTTIEGAAGSTIGSSSLIYRYTVAGADKASIDTGVDTADAGSGDWTNGDLLEIFMTLRTDDAGVTAFPTVILNNDTGANYDTEVINANNASLSAASGLAGTAWTLTVHGSGGTANYPTSVSLVIPDYAGTTFYKVGEWTETVNDGTAANNQLRVHQLGYRSTSAITRLKVAAAGVQKLKIGSQLLIYKRLAS